MFKKIKFLLYSYLVRKLGYYQKPDENWKPGYIRYFEIVSYPKEGWINTFHNYDNEEQLRIDLGRVFADDFWGGMLPKNLPQIVKKFKKSN